MATHGVAQFDGRMPLGLEEATRFLRQRLPAAGLRLYYVRKRPDEFRGFYEVTGFGGRFKVTRLQACPGATAFSVSARPTLLGRSAGE